MRLPRTVLAAVSLAGLALPAQAQDDPWAPGAEMLVPGKWYFGAGYRYQTIRLPRIDNAMRSLPSAAALTTLEPDFNAHGLNGSIGYVYRDGAYPAWLGQNLRVEVNGWWVTSNYQSTGGNFGTIPSISLFRIDGVNSGISGAHLDTSSSIRVVAQQWQIALRAATDHPLTPQWFVSPEIAIIGGRQNDDYKLFERGVQTATFNDQRIYDVNTTRIGGQFGSRLTYKPINTVAFHVGGYVGVLHTSASLKALEVFSTGTPVIVNVNNDRSAAAFITGGQVGAAVSGGFFTLSLVGGVDYNSKAAGVRVPTFADSAPISLVFDSAVNYHAMLTLKLRIP
ncbi:MAG TPA: hypothetical protein VIF14_06570 [Alphaproteobacteria bacterium]|jgi:hypothetical protein